ncbi:hypothetical protein Micbo1qcDRAFT_165017 [Microdochium bolleyi]|uniref:Uncharacterized protein n=1 Tax=Microdochium bolleyi TaxID=196109 RepID=A0A136IXV3_9PEZI|nr:hypothetical protein Micbo1qcDRAFT_165017 [Microdochium bolleyi]
MARLVYYAAGAAGTRCGDGTAGAGHVDETVNAKGDEGEDDEEDDDDDGDGVVLLDHGCGCASEWGGCMSRVVVLRVPAVAEWKTSPRQ